MTGARDTCHVIEAGGNRLRFDASVGNLREVRLRHGTRNLAPLHTAHWVGGPVPDRVPPVERHLSGDFFCAPFGQTGDPEVPAHGWPANSRWEVKTVGGAELQATLARSVQGAIVHKSLRLMEDAPLLLQEHVIEGGGGPITVSHHPMVHIASRARLSLSPKRAFVTPDAPLEPSHALRYPTRANEPHALPGRDGPVDLTRLPIGDGTEDFLTCIQQGTGLGWSAVLRETEDDIVFIVKDARVLPVTMLWHSNGGRPHAPWDGLHRGVIGIEDGCTAGTAPPHVAAQPNVVSEEGVTTCLTLAPGTRHRIAHVIGAIARPADWTTVTNITCDGDQLILTGDAGAPRVLPFPNDFFTQETRHGGR